MTKDQAFDAVMAQINDFTAPFQTRVEASLPVATGIFCSEYQWEFLDVYADTIAALDATSGKHVITNPADFFKPVVLYTDTCPEIEYIDRYKWAGRQQGTVGSQSPRAYTLIGSQMFLDRPSNGETIHIVYTQSTGNLSFENVPGQYHPAIVMAMVMWLTPSVVDDGSGNKLPNPAFDAAEERYLKAVARATGVEMSNKGRPRRFEPTQGMKLRAGYSR